MSEYGPVVGREYPGNVILEADTPEALQTALGLIRSPEFTDPQDSIIVIRDGVDPVGVLCGPSLEAVRGAVSLIREEVPS